MLIQPQALLNGRQAFLSQPAARCVSIRRACVVSNVRKLTKAGASAPVIKPEVASTTGTASRGVSGANALEGDAVTEKELAENGD